MENNYYMIAIAINSVAIILLGIIYKTFNTKITHLENKFINLAATQAMMAHQVQEFIIEDLAIKSRSRELTDTEREQFQASRKLLYEIENKLKDVGYYKKSSA